MLQAFHLAAKGRGFLGGLADKLHLAFEVQQILLDRLEEGALLATGAAPAPASYRRGELTHALEAAEAEGIAITDEAMAMERTGLRPLLVEGAEDNIKVTTAADLALAAYLLRQST